MTLGLRAPWRPTFAHIVGITAALALAAAGARASETPQPKVASVDRWAVVDSLGALARGLGAVSATLTSTSWYDVTFDKSIANCVSLATLGNPSFNIPPKGHVTAGFPRSTDDQETLTVHTSNSAGNEADRGFHLLVVCQGSARAGAGPAPRAAASDRWAVLNADGSLVRGKGVASQARLGTGAYEVIFDREVRSCVYVATIGIAVTGIIPPPGEISVASRGNNRSGVYIRTWDTAGASADRPFHLFVGCEAAAARTSDPWAAVNRNGTLALGSGAVSSARLGTGAYEVIFDRNVRNCVYIATLARDRRNFAYTVGEVSVAPRGNNKNGVYVRTWLPDGTIYDRSFHLYVGCGRTPA